MCVRSRSRVVGSGRCSVSATGEQLTDRLVSEDVLELKASPYGCIEFRDRDISACEMSVSTEDGSMLVDRMRWSNGLRPGSDTWWSFLQGVLVQICTGLQGPGGGEIIGATIGSANAGSVLIETLRGLPGSLGLL